MFVTITSITTIMRARMLRAVSPLLIWFWSAFPWLLCNFVFKSSVAASLMCDMMHDEWLQCQSAWECVDACMSVAICAVGVELWCMCVRTVMRKCTHVMPAIVCLWWRPIAFEYIWCCIAREVPLMLVKIWLRCGTCRLTWNMKNIWMRKCPEILFKQYFGSYSAAADHPPPLLHRLWRQHRENLGRGRAAAGRGAERSHEHRVVSCVRLEREVLGVRWEERSMSSGAIWLHDERDGLRGKNSN